MNDSAAHFDAQPPANAAPAWLQTSIDRACGEILRGQARHAVLDRLCADIAQGLALPLVMLAQRHDEGVIEIEATSHENLLWAELQRVPERMDSSITGQGPAAQALRSGAPAQVAVTDESFIAWRAAALREGIGAASALPLGPHGTDRALVVFLPSGGANVPDLAPIALALDEWLVLADSLARDRLLAAALAQAGSPAFIASADGAIQWCNDAFTQLSGYRAEDLVGQNPRLLSSGQHGVNHYRELWNTILSGHVWRGETVDRQRDGDTFTAVQTISPIRIQGRTTNFLALYQDVTREKVEQERRELRTGIDPLSGLMHRAPLQQRIEHHLSQGVKVDLLRITALEMSTLATLGEDACDTFIEELERRLGNLAGPSRVARLGPGDYLAWLPDAPDAAAGITNALTDALLAPYPYLGELPAVNLRFGRAQGPRDGRTVQDLLLKADRDLANAPPIAAASLRRTATKRLNTRH